MSRFDEFYDYTENLVLAQYNVAEIIQHELTKGEVREDFVIDILIKHFSNGLNMFKGFLDTGHDQSNQLDIILLKRDVPVAAIGNQKIVLPENCLMVMEVKGNATGNDIKEFNEKAGKIKAMQAPSHPICGMFCYKVQLTKKNIMRRFGWDFDAATLSYYDEGQTQIPTNPLPLEYPNLDFFISVEKDNADDKQVYLRLDKHKDRFVQTYEFPVMKNLFSLIHSLLQS